MSSGNTYVLDTNVILYDPRAHYSFSDSKVIIPIQVIEELDKHKKGNDTKAINARSFIRDIEFKQHDWLEVALKTLDCNMSGGLELNSNDNKILGYAYYNKAILVTRDYNLRIKAKAVDVRAIDYDNGKVQSEDGLPMGYKIIDVETEELMAHITSSSGSFELPELKSKANEYVVFKMGRQSIITRYDLKLNKYIICGNSKNVAGISPKNLEQTLAIDALLNPDIPLVALTGKAGTGKTLIALAAAIASKSQYTQIFISRPTVDVERGIGFLPGLLEEKLDPYMQPLYDNLKVIESVQKSDKAKSKIKELEENNKIEIQALNFIRGRSLPKIYFLIDEAQNASIHEIKTIVTRAGEGAKFVLIGDVEQVDTPYLDRNSNGLSYLIDKMDDDELFAHIHLIKGERSLLAERASHKL